MKIKRRICAHQMRNNPQEFEFELTEFELSVAAQEYNHLLNYNAIKHTCKNSVADEDWYKNLTEEAREDFLHCAADYFGDYIDDDSCDDPWGCAINEAKDACNIEDNEEN